MIATTLGIHNIAEKGEQWLDNALGNHKKTILQGKVRGLVSFSSSFWLTHGCF